jgi:hypothetical protein
MKIFGKTYQHHIYNVIPVPQFTAGIHTLIFFFLIIHPVVMPLIADEDIPARSSGGLDFYVDYAIFDGGENDLYYCEFYVMLYAGQIVGELSNGNNIGKIEIHSEITNLESGDKNESQWQTEITLDQDSLRNRTLAVYDQYMTSLTLARYKVEVTIKDMIGHTQGKAVLDLALVDQELNHNISQIEFVSDIEKSSVRDQFYKDGRKIFPNPSRRYGLLSPKLYFYYELYNLEDVQGRHVEITYSIISDIDSLSKSFPAKRITIPANKFSIVHGLDVSHYASGIYRLRVSATNSAEDLHLQSERRFEIIQQDHLIAEATINANQIKSVSDILTYLKFIILST